MANFIALRDQENLVRGNQTTAAAKPQNHGTRQLQPKTPGQKAPKTPFKIPLNDENALHGAKTGLNTGAKMGENFLTAKKGTLQAKNAFVTPMAGPKTRAPLGQKTTNAKAKPVDNDLAKSKAPSAKVRKATPKLAHTEPSKLNVLLDKPLEEQEIEYMPPRPEPLPDIPDDIPADFDLSIFKDQPLLGGAWQDYYNEPDESGTSLADRERLRDQRDLERDEREMSIRIERDLTISTFYCWHDPECSGECKDKAETMRKAEETFQRKMARLDQEQGNAVAARRPETLTKKPMQEKNEGPSTLTSKRAASALSMPRTTPAAGAPSYAKPTQAAAARSVAVAPSATRKLPPASNARNRVTPGRAASRSTIGYAKGRSTSAALRAMSDRGNTLAPSTKAANVRTATDSGSAQPTKPSLSTGRQGRRAPVE